MISLAVLDSRSRVVEGELITTEGTREPVKNRSTSAAHPIPLASPSTAGSLPSFHQSHLMHMSTPRPGLCSTTYPDVPTPSTVNTPVLPSPLNHAGTKMLSSNRVSAKGTPDSIPSPIDTPGSSRAIRSIGEGRGRRDDPATPLPLGTAAFSKLKGKKDYQTLTKHFEAFAKTVAKQNAGTSTLRGKGKGRSADRASSTAGLGGKVFEGLRFCIPPELGQVTKHKQRWDIVSSLFHLSY